MRQGLMFFKIGWRSEHGASGFFLLQMPKNSVNVGKCVRFSGKRLNEDVVIANQRYVSELWPGTTTYVFVYSVALYKEINKI